MSDPAVTVGLAILLRVPVSNPSVPGRGPHSGLLTWVRLFFALKRPVGPVPTSAPRPRAFPVLVELTEGDALGAVTEGTC